MKWLDIIQIGMKLFEVPKIEKAVGSSPKMKKSV